MKIKNNGFTLIELLAVIVILAIIAVIAVPIVLNIINDTKESAILRSADFYLDGIELSLAQATLKNKNITDGVYNISEGNICLNTDCSDKLEVEIKGEVPKTGSIFISKGQIEDISLNIEDKIIGQNNKGEIVYYNKLTDICELKTATEENKISAGDKYECKVKAGTKYTFYVLTEPTDKSVNLIMDQNINSDGTPAGMTGTRKSGENVYNLVAWNNESGQSTNAYGPVTAMTFLYNATKDWTNIDPVNYTYNDKTTQGTTAENTSYTSFVSTNGVAVITPLSGDGITIGTSDAPLRARMPIFAGNTSITEVTSKTNAPYLYDNIDLAGNAAPYGYLTLSSNADFSNYAWRVDNDGYVDYGHDVDVDFGLGVRAVINLKI